MEVDYQKYLQLFVANGYCVLENDIYVYLPDVQGGKPDCANSPLSRFFVRARCSHVLAPSDVAAVEVANSLLPGFFAGARCPLSWHPPKLQRPTCTAKTRRVFQT